MFQHVTLVAFYAMLRNLCVVYGVEKQWYTGITSSSSGEKSVISGLVNPQSEVITLLLVIDKVVGLIADPWM